MYKVWNSSTDFGSSSQEIKHKRRMAAKIGHPQLRFCPFVGNEWKWCIINWESNWRTNLVLTWSHPKWWRKEKNCLFHLLCGEWIPISQGQQDSRVRLPGLLCQSIFSLPSAVCTSARHSSLVDPPGLLFVRIVAPVITTIDYNHPINHSSITHQSLITHYSNHPITTL